MILRSEKHLEITCQNINLHSRHLQPVLFHWIWPWRHSVFYWTNVWCSVTLERKLITYAYTCIYRHARKITWRSHRLHCEVEIVQSNSSCQRSESDINMINGNAQFTHLQVWMLYQNTHVNLVLHSIFARKRNVPTHAHQPQDHKCYCHLGSYRL